MHSSNGMLTVNIHCEHISYELLESVFTDFSYSYKDITTVITAALMGTDFMLAGTDVTKKTDIAYTEECNAKQILTAIANNWGAELKFDRYNVYAMEQIGENRGVDFRFGKNILGLKRTVDRSQKDADGNPKVSYEVDVADLSLLGDEFADLEKFSLGDTVRIVDTALNIEQYKRIVKLEKDVLSGRNTSITLGEPSSSVSRTISEMKQQTDAIKASAPEWNKIKEITDNLGNVIASKLAGTLQLMSAQIQNSTSTFEITDNGIYFHNQPTEEDSTFACLLNSTGILFANAKDGEGKWIWQTAIGADGVVATKVIASALYGLLIEGVTINAGTLNGGKINGVTIEGSTIYAGDRTAGTYIEITNEGAIYGYHDNALTFRYSAGNDDGILRLYSSTNPDGTLVLSSNHLVDGDAFAAVMTDGSYIYIGGTSCEEIRFLRPTENGAALIIRDGEVIVNGDLTVTGYVSSQD